MTTRRGVNAGNAGSGSHWIRDEKRRRIYVRDGWRCVWCGSACKMANMFVGSGTEADVRLATLDHVLPRACGGSNESGNLITSCAECNAKRGDRSAIEHAYAITCDMVADAATVLNRVIEAMGRELPPREQKAKAA